MLFKFDKEKINFLKREDKYYLIANSNMFGGIVRFGDFSMYMVLLHILKKELVKQCDFLNDDNFYFILNRIGGIKFGDVKRTLKLFKPLAGEMCTDDKNFNVNQIISPANIWTYKTYLEHIDHKIDEDDEIIRLFLDDMAIDKKDIHILPNVGKQYNQERNWNQKLLNKIISKAKGFDTIKIIQLDNYRINLDFLKSYKNKNIKIITNCTWFDVIHDIGMTSKKFVCGDCGMMHFVSNLPNKYRPEIDCYFKTRTNTDKNSFNIIKRIAGEDISKFDTSVNFKPYSAYKSAKINIKKF